MTNKVQLRSFLPQSRGVNIRKETHKSRIGLFSQFWDYWRADFKRRFNPSALLMNLLPCMLTICYLGIQEIVAAMGRSHGTYGITQPSVGGAMSNYKIHYYFALLMSISIFFIIIQRIWLVTKDSGRIEENRVVYIRFNRSVVYFVQLLNDALQVIFLNFLIIVIIMIIFYVYPFINSHVRTEANNPMNANQMSLHLSGADFGVMVLIVLLSGFTYFFIMYHVYFVIALTYHWFPKFQIKWVQSIGAIFGSIIAWAAIILIYFLNFSYPTQLGSLFKNHPKLFICMPIINVGYIGAFPLLSPHLYPLVIVPVCLGILYYLLTQHIVARYVKRYLLLV